MDVDIFRAKFRLKSVVDSWNNQLTVHEAVENGVIDINKSLYINKRNGDRCTIHEAIQRGLVVQMTPMERINELRQMGQARATRRLSAVPRVNSVRTTEDVDQPEQRPTRRLERSYSLRETSSRRVVKPQMSVVGCFYGLISFKHKIRTLKYTIVSARDTRSGEMWPFKKAKEGGIIDTEAKIFIDSASATSITFKEAIEQELIDINISEETVNDDVDHTENYVVYGVMDLLDKRRLTFKDALDNFILVREPAVYRDTLNHVDVHLYEAIMQRLVVAKFVEGSSYNLYDQMISDENRLETDRETKAYIYDDTGDN